MLVGIPSMGHKSNPLNLFNPLNFFRLHIFFTPRGLCSWLVFIFFLALLALLCLCCPVSRPVRAGLEEASADTVVYLNINLILVNTDTILAKAKIAAMSLKFMFGQIKYVL